MADFSLSDCKPAEYGIGDFVWEYIHDNIIEDEVRKARNDTDYDSENVKVSCESIKVSSEFDNWRPIYGKDGDMYRFADKFFNPETGETVSTDELIDRIPVAATAVLEYTVYGKEYKDPRPDGYSETMRDVTNEGYRNADIASDFNMLKLEDIPEDRFERCYSYDEQEIER